MLVMGPLLHPRVDRRLGDDHPGSWWPPHYNRDSLTKRLNDFEIQTVKGISSQVYGAIIS